MCTDANAHTYINAHSQMLPYSSGRNFLLSACKSIVKPACLEPVLYLLWKEHVDASWGVEKVVLLCWFWAMESFPHVLQAGEVKNTGTKPNI